MSRLLILLESLLRYQLLPYLYTMFWQYIEEGIPMLKPLVYYDQSDIQTHYRNDEFVLEIKF
jgi:alpha-glucosidase